ncbi:hypothetical protein [Bradyrhizobium sp.]|uniref:hypothetical protein n=1 Tax=Bradyrhizobium sp. TaxID=376 RepID=UPI002639A093|nr:hypothetical protein [Bradyrhizobium sp.]
MSDALELLERKRVLVERRQWVSTESLPEIERELRQINQALSRIEMKDVSPTAPE